MYLPCWNVTRQGLVRPAKCGPRVVLVHGNPVDADEVEVRVMRVEYDLERAAAAIRASALPDELADYLLRGGSSRPAEEAADAG
jgi:hypothetical protein